jgi:uncharacterized protein (DUF1697 family)
VPVIILSAADLEACFTSNPFFEEKGADTKKLYVAFVSKELRAENSNDLKISQFKPDEAHLDGNRVLLNMR